MRTIVTLLLAFACSAIFAGAPAHALFTLPEGFEAGVYAEVSVFSYRRALDLEQGVEDERWDPSPVTDGQFVLSVADEVGFNSTATVVAQVGRGYARLDAIAIARHEGEGDSSASVYAGVGFSDVITLSAPGLAGTTGTVLLGIFAEGALSAAHSRYDGAVDAVAGGIAAVLSGSDYQLFQVSSPGFSIFPAAENLNDEFLGQVVTFVYGQPFQFRYALEVEGSADVDVDLPDASGVATFVGDFGHTITWAGIQDLRDQSGAPVVDFTVTSLSGTDYRDRIVPVPEPGTALAVLTGLAALAQRRWR